MTSNTDTTKVSYGSRGQTWAPEFISYMHLIVHHPNYAGMPDALKSDNKIQWEAPSNRSGGQFQFTHQKRRDWWEKKAKEIGIDTRTNQWISRVAKLIHPTGEKPCKRCGKTMRIGYVYPTANFLKKLKKEYGSDFDASQNTEISTILTNIIDNFGNGQLRKIPLLLKSKNTDVPDFSSKNELLAWLNSSFIPSEPSILSPGAMSNAPDRFDGFHSFNRCCRGKADKGRNVENLKSYVTDRRVFEFWSDGDWITADRLMGAVRTDLSNALCEDGGDGPPTADHIGPISLGFSHQPVFRLLSQAANSSKNNRMTLSDVEFLKSQEADGETVASWYAQPLWDLRKNSVTSEETALRLSKALRDNQRVAMQMLCFMYQKRQIPFLIYLLNLGFAERTPTFINLRAEGFLTVYDKINYEVRSTKYVVEQKSRRIRIGMEALQKYLTKDNRHNSYDFSSEEKILLLEAEKKLNSSSNSLQELKPMLLNVLMSKELSGSDNALRTLVEQVPKIRFEDYELVIKIMQRAMHLVAIKISKSWESDRYIRE
jgi:Alw26I/Eco31I/Esp3I family type II restriction endonuclease